MDSRCPPGRIRRRVGLLLGLSVVVALTGCAPWQPLVSGTEPPSSTAPGTAVPSPTDTTPGTPPGTPPPDETEPPLTGDRVISSRLSQDWIWPGPGRPITVLHDNAIPIAPPPEPPLPYLYSIGVGAHPSDTPAFDQMSFRFAGGFPGYELEFVPRLVGDASGLPIPMPGTNTVLRVVFHSAQAHTEDGRSSIVASPPPFVGFTAIKRYTPAGDFEGYVSYGIGIGRPMEARALTPVRVYEVEKIEQGRHLYVVAIQIDARHWK
ncbi:hypothetical protein [Cryobacterium sp. PH31-AA6]|uniref:AMIN-like domain-containing (lipo)protein n=1 Tax=Cryobacterium sp. PH31-AA6 TaxID=3046205 RepID=UPI0024BAAC35|nr:hypothetical protein [Cryobacterium sp. PH31-AA6]